MSKQERRVWLVLSRMMGMKKTVVCVALVIVMAALTGLLCGALF